MKKSLLLAASLVTLAALTGCNLDSSDDSGSSSNDIVSDPRQDTGATYGTAPKDEEPLPALDGNGAESTISNKKIARQFDTVNVKLVLDFPKPPVEAPAADDDAK